MKTVATLVVMAVVTMAAGGCTAPVMNTASEHPDPAHNARNSLGWAGSYRGTLPCADCAGIETVVTLVGDETYRIQSRYLGKGSQVFSERGTFSWNEAGSTIALEGGEPVRYFVGENHLVRLAQDGSRITGALAERYVLIKVSDGMTGT